MSEHQHCTGRVRSAKADARSQAVKVVNALGVFPDDARLIRFIPTTAFPGLCTAAMSSELYGGLLQEIAAVLDIFEKTNPGESSTETKRNLVQAVRSFLHLSFLALSRDCYRHHMADK